MTNIPQRDLLLLAGIPGTGKTCYGDRFASEFGFAHYDLEDHRILGRFVNLSDLISELLSVDGNVVVTWGFNPEDSTSLELLCQLRNAGFDLIWFDGNRNAALRAFRRRHTVPEEALDAQISRIERTKIVERLKPVIINSFDDSGNFRSPADLLTEIRGKLSAKDSRSAT